MSDREMTTLQRDGVAVTKERLYRLLLAGCAALTLAVTSGIIIALLGGTVSFFSEVSIVAYLTGTEWSPVINGKFGVLPLLSGTLVITVVSAVVALPIGLSIAVYLSEYATPKVRSVLKPALEILAAIPTVVYGYFALVYVTPFLDDVLPLDFGTFNALSAGVAVGLVIIPMVSSISEDAISSVPDSLRNAAYGLGSTKFDVSTKVVVPAATSGIVSSYVLALSRAIGETMIVVIAAGLSPKMPFFPDILKNLTNSVQTITSGIVQVAGAENASGVLLNAMFALGMTLFVLTLTMNILAEAVRRRYREEYS
jgi:phosphate transport system permease protein